MSIFGSVGFDADSIEKFLDYIYSDKNKEYEADYITFNNEYCCYHSLDDSFEVWSKEGGEEIFLCFSYNSGVMDKIENLQEEKEDSSDYYKIFKCNLLGCPYPIYVEFPSACIPKMLDNGQYMITLAGDMYSMDLYKSEEEFSYAYSGISIESVAPFVEYDIESKLSTALLYINGRIKSIEKRVNSFTGVSYYKLIIASYKHDYIVFAEEGKVPLDIALGDIVNVCVRMIGRFEFDKPVSTFLEWKSTDGEERFNAEIAPVLLYLKPLYFEFLVVDFDAESMVDGVEFIQTIMDRNNGTMLVEAKKTIDGIKYLYRLENLEMHNVLKIFYDLCVCRKKLNLSVWEDVSDEIFKNRSVALEDDGLEE